MRITPIVEALVASGASPEMILAAVKAAEEQAMDAIEKRRAADRERQRRHRANVMSRDVTVTECDAPLDKERSPQTPLKEINPPPISPQPPCRFDEFWAAYPRKVGKGQAMKAWKTAIKRADPAVIISAITQQAALWKREKRAAEFIPHPSTWLNGERWSDEVAGAEPDEPEVAAARARGLSEVYWTWPQNREWLRRIHQLSQGKGRWMNHWSAPPWEPGCTCPKAILEAFPEAIEFARGGDHVRAAE